MPLLRSLLRGHAEQARSITRLFIFSRVGVCRDGCRNTGLLLKQFPRHWAHGVAQRAHHEADVRNTRNIGIIAHVDAVRCLPSQQL